MPYIGQGLISCAAGFAILAAILPLSLPKLRTLLTTYTLFVVLAFALLLFAHVTDDFSLLNVVRHSHTLKPMLYKIAGVWGNHEGSMLLWLLILSGYTAVLLKTSRLPDAPQKTLLSLMALLNGAFAAFIALACDPFAPMAIPLQEGLDLNPMLQDPALAIHPPMLYLGYVGFSVPFCWILTLLIHQTHSKDFYRWSLFAWTCLTTGILLGSFWAYYELGWGGWWFWDPVENAALMPWLAATAFIHCQQMNRNDDTLLRWTWFLGLLTFSLCLAGLVLVRSGVLSSVHAFANDPERGLLLLLLTGLISGSAFIIYAVKCPRTAPSGLTNTQSLVALSSLLLIGALATVFIGTTYPLLAEAMGHSLTVGAPYFNKTVVPLLLLALIPMGAAPFLPRYQKTMTAFTIAGVTTLACYYAGIISHVIGAAAILLGFWVVISTLLSCRRLALGLAHAGAGIAIIGMALSSMNEEDALKAMGIGESISLNKYTTSLKSMQKVDGRNYQAQQATFTLTRPGLAKELTPEVRLYWTQNMIHGETSIVIDGLHHIYASLGDVYANGQVSVRITYKPFINLMWGGGLLACLGCFLAFLRRRYSFLP